jgi:hypothetical protein
MAAQAAVPIFPLASSVPELVIRDGSRRKCHRTKVWIKAYEAFSVLRSCSNKSDALAQHCNCHLGGL